MWWISIALAGTAPVAVEGPDGPGCEAGDGAACTRLGVAYANGKDGVPADPFIAGRFFRQGCEAEDANGCMYLAEAYRRGTGVLVDATRAPELYERACELGAGLGCRSVADLVVLGSVPDAAPDAAGGWYARGCALGDAQSCTAAGLDIERDGDTATSLPLLERGCNLGHARACTLLGVRYGKGSDGARRSPGAAIEWYRKGCALRPFDPESCREVGWAEYTALESKDPASGRQAWDHLDEACYRNDTLACRYLARVAVDWDQPSEALMAAERACDLGDVPACRLKDRLLMQAARAFTLP